MTQTSGGLLDALLVPLLVVLSISAVAIIVWLVWTLTRTKDSASDQSRVPSWQSHPEASEPRTASEPPYLVGLHRDAFRRVGAGEWVIHIAGKPYTTLDAVPDPETRDQVVSALRAFADFSRGYIQKQKPTSGPAVQASPGSGTPVPGVTLPDEVALRREAALGATMPTIDLAKEIGDIVEEMVERSPTMRDHTIRLQNVPGQGIAFVVDGVRYSELNDIPSSTVQALIREATKEWERR